MSHSLRPLLVRYGLAVVAVVPAIAMRLALAPWLEDRAPFGFLYLMVLVVAGVFGQGPALATTVLGAVAAEYFVIEHRIGGVGLRAGMVLYLIVGSGIALLGGSLRGARRRAEAEARLAGEVREREGGLLADAALANAKFRAFFEQGPLFAGIMALDGTILEPNRLSLDSCGYSREQVTGRKFWECPWWGGSPGLVARVEEGCARAAAGGTFRGELPYFVAGGEQRVVDLIILPIRDDAGRILFLAPTGTDITERTRAESALRQSEAWFRHLAGAMPQIVWINRPDASVEYYNDRWFEYTGLSPEESYRSEGWASAIHPDDLPRVVEAGERARATGAPFEAELRLRHHSGAYRWHLGRSVVVRERDGRVVRQFGTTTDIDDRKRVERDARFLAEASATLAAIVDEAETLRKVAHLAVPSFADWCTVDLAGPDGRPARLAVAHVDPAKVELAREVQRRYPPDPDSPAGVPAVIREGASRMVAEISDEMIEAGAVDPDHLEILRQIGLRSWMCVPLTGRGGTLGAISFVSAESGRIYDRADLQLAEDLASRAAIALENARLFREVRDSEAKFRQLADAMPQIVWTARPDGAIDYFNRRWSEYTGLSSFGPETRFGESTWIPFVHPDDVEGSLERWRRAVSTGEPFEVEHRFQDRASGGYRWHLGRALPVLDESGRVVKWIGTETDIDDRKRAEAALRAAKNEAEEANRAKTQFLAVLSHELRTPLNPILLATSSMLDRPVDPELIRPTLEMIRQNVNLQARLIDDLLDVMRIVRGKMPLQWEVANGHDLIEHAIQVCRSEISGAGLRLETELAATCPHINADPARIQQVFWNLIKNAVKFTTAGGTIAVRTRDLPAVDGEGGGRLVIEVVDTGIGLEPDVLPRIFEPFQQGETTITRKYGGLGLGLAICRGIVEAHAGTIVAESPGVGRGSTFRIHLPTVPAPAAEANGQVPDGSAAGSAPGRRVLLVEDEPATLRLLARLIRDLGHDVATAATIAEAIDLALGREFDLIISDIGLPDGTGLDLMRRVVSARGEIPAIALTGYGMEEDIRRSREAGFAEHMTKPIDFTKLEVIIRRIAAGAAGAGRA